jgi:hypothetical protein
MIHHQISCLEAYEGPIIFAEVTAPRDRKLIILLTNILLSIEHVLLSSEENERIQFLSGTITGKCRETTKTTAKNDRFTQSSKNTIGHDQMT